MSLTRRVIATRDGSATVEQGPTQVTYHSRFGALTETKHVFIKCGLNSMTASDRPLNLLEYGFGTGLNALATAVEGHLTQRAIRYESLEAFPLDRSAYGQLQYGDLFPDVPQATSWFDKMHSGPWEEEMVLFPGFNFLKRKTTFEAFEPEENFYDLIYFDAFAPSLQEELWRPPLTEQCYQALRPGGRLITYCAQGAYKRHLKAAGFTITPLPGPPGKREITQADKPW